VHCGGPRPCLASVGGLHSAPCMPSSPAENNLFLAIVLSYDNGALAAPHYQSDTLCTNPIICSAWQPPTAHACQPSGKPNRTPFQFPLFAWKAEKALPDF